MLEIAIGNCNRCDIETINDLNNSQYFWINRRDLEIETKRNWQAIFDKCKDSLTQKYKKEFTPNVTFQPNKIFVRNDLFEKIIKSCKATNLEFLKLKEKLGLSLYEDMGNEQEITSMSEEILKKKKVFTQHDVENKQLKEESKKLRKEENEKIRKEERQKLKKEENDKLRKEESEELRNENEQLRKNNVVKNATIKESIGIKSPEEDKNMTDSYPN